MTETQPNTANKTPESGLPPMDRVRQEMERWMEVARATGERALESLGLVPPGRPSVPAIDVLDLETELVLLVDLPGVAAESVELSLAGNMLTIKATPLATNYPESTRKLLVERSTARFERSLPLPGNADLESIRAETRDGLLTITLRKLVPPPGRSIPVGRAANGGHATPVDTI
jgi:HSP20 family protein